MNFMPAMNLRNSGVFLFGLFAVALVLNLVWENVQMTLYQSYGSFWQHFPVCARASLWDAGYITALYLGIAFLNNDFFWIRQRQAKNYLLIIGVSLLVAWWIELDALRDGRWAYGERMPLVSGVGLTPLLQLPILSLLSYEVLQRLPFVPVRNLGGQRMRRGVK